MGREAAYRDKTPEEPEDPLKDATTLYVGNLYAIFSNNNLRRADKGPCLGLSTLQRSRYMNFSQSQLRLKLQRAFLELMVCRCGEIKRLVMGLDRFHKTPCGFCFVEYYNHQDALDCMKYIGGTKLDERIIRTDLDPGFQEGRQYGSVSHVCRIFCGADGTSDEVNREDRFETNTETSLIQEEVVMDVLLQKRDRRRKTSTVRAGSRLVRYNAYFGRMYCFPR